jgi:hypothetical protein
MNVKAPHRSASGEMKSNRRIHDQRDVWGVCDARSSHLYERGSVRWRASSCAPGPLKFHGHPSSPVETKALSHVTPAEGTWLTSGRGIPLSEPQFSK